MNKNNEKQRTTHEIYGEPKKIYEHIKEKPMKTTKTNEKPKKEQRKTMENQRQFCQHSKVTFCQRFLVPVFSRFSSSMGKEIRDNFGGKKQSKRVLETEGS